MRHCCEVPCCLATNPVEDESIAAADCQSWRRLPARRGPASLSIWVAIVAAAIRDSGAITPATVSPVETEVVKSSAREHAKVVGGIVTD